MDESPPEAENSRVYVPAHVESAVLWMNSGYCDPAPIPDYRDGALGTAYAEFVEAFGAKYAADPRVDSIVIGSIGVDGEAVLAKDEGECYWRSAAMGIPGLEYAWGQWVKRSIPLYRQAFPAKAVYFPIAAGGAARCGWAEICGAQVPPVGLKHNGAWVDIPDWDSTGEPCCGAWTAFQICPECPAMIETKTDLGDGNLPWALYAGASEVYPGSVVVHPGYLDRLPEGFLRQLALTYGKTAGTTPYAQIVFRDREYPQDWCYSGKRGDHVWWMRRTEGGEPALTGDEVPAAARADYRGRWVRRGPMRLEVDAIDTSRGCSIEVDWFDAQTEAWAISWWDGDKRRARQVEASGSQEWRTTVATGVDLDTSQYIGIEGEPYLHRVRVVSWGQMMDTPTPLPTSGATATPTATATARPSPTATPTPESTPTMTIQEAIYDFETYLNGRLFAEWGGFWAAKVTIQSGVGAFPVEGGAP